MIRGAERTGEWAPATPLGVSPTPQIRRWASQPQGAQAPLPVAGWWDLRWDDGVIVALRRESAGVWSHTDHAWVREIYRYPSFEPLPQVRCATRRELVEVLTEWRRRDLRAWQRAIKEAGTTHIYPDKLSASP